MNEYDIGDAIRVSGSFRDATGVFVDPGMVKGEWQVGTEVTVVTAVRDSTGHYHFDIDVTAAGFYSYRMVGSGANKGAAEGRFRVAESQFATPLP